MKCLVTKLKATVNDPSLPVLETMQQFTLDAIAASGNSVMTDVQKLALNHFFYQIGAIDNNTLWGKIKYLAMPMICNDNIAKAFHDYVSGTDYPTEYGSFDSNHGYINTEEGAIARTVIITTDSFTGSTYNMSVVFATMLDGFAALDTPSAMFMTDNNSPENRLWHYIKKRDAGNNFAVNNSSFSNFWTKPSFIGDNVYDIGSVNSGADFFNVKVISTKNDVELYNAATAKDMPNRASAVTYQNKALKYQSYTGVSTGLAMMAEAFTDTERDIVMNAVKNLKLTFAVS